MKVIAQNKKATHDYAIEERYEAGIQLKGSEVKSIRAAKTNINDAYVIFQSGEAYVLNMHVAKYEESSIFNHEETRTRKLLLNKREINKLLAAKQTEGYTVIPLRLYLKEGLIKLEIALAKGKKNYDKRQALKEKDDNIRMQKQLKRY